MATQQNEGGVPFAVAHELRSFRLLELPPEIVELLEAPDPPQYVLCIHGPSLRGYRANASLGCL